MNIWNKCIQYQPILILYLGQIPTRDFDSWEKARYYTQYNKCVVDCKIDLELFEL